MSGGGGVDNLWARAFNVFAAHVLFLGELMTMQNDAWVISLVGIGLVALLFIHVVAQAGKTAPDPTGVQKKAYALRRPLFWALIVLGIGVAYGTLRTFPIPKQQGALHPAQTVQVVAHQWSWEITWMNKRATRPIPTNETTQASFCIVIVIGSPITEHVP